ncbi:MAG TPA: hypothetical protein VLJ17_11710, partial [Xanthobacteraceae bacterium]|nr:hypothetical protein [Xanthobacteraceae bacterium]
IAARPQLLLPGRTSSTGLISESSSPLRALGPSSAINVTIFAAAESQRRASTRTSDFRLERDKFASTSRKGRLTNPGTAEHGLFKQKQLIVVGESATPRVVRVLTSFEVLLYDPDPQIEALWGALDHRRWISV